MFFCPKLVSIEFCEKISYIQYLAFLFLILFDIRFEIYYSHIPTEEGNGQADKYWLLFSATSKLNALHRRVNQDDFPPKRECTKKHQAPFSSCIPRVIDDLPLSCGQSYEGRTLRCLNDSHQEHANNVNQRYGSSLAPHCWSCGCSPKFKEVTMIQRHTGQHTCEIIEAFATVKCGPFYISTASVQLLDMEICKISNLTPHTWNLPVILVIML